MGARGQDRKQGGRTEFSGRFSAFPRNAVSLFAAVILLFGATVPSWHAANSLKAAAFDLAALQTIFGSEPEAFSASICHHDETGTPEAPADGPPLPGKTHCPLCLALQIFSPAVSPQGFVLPAFSGQTVSLFALPGVALRDERAFASLGRPRAPPSA